METLGGLACRADVIEGRDDGRAPLVLLHGLTFDRAMWRPVLAEMSLTDPGRGIIAIDLPGHGESAAWRFYDMRSVAAAVHELVCWTRLDAPVIVGHSASAVIATIYAATYPSRGVVNVDQWLRMEPFAELAKAVSGDIRGAGFGGAWRQFEDSMHIEMVPTQARRLLRPVTEVRRDVVAGYWREVIERPANDLAADIEAALAKLRAAGTSYQFIAGHPVEPEYRDWLGRQLPQATIETWPDSGHFPHLTHPVRFAARLADTGSWGDAV